MATSQNGWTVRLTGKEFSVVTCPPIVGYVRGGDVGVVLNWVTQQFDKYVEDVHRGRDDWGGAVRPIRGKTSGYSNHASFTAIDLNATRHPRGVSGTFSAAQKRAVRKHILDPIDRISKGAIRWGEDYNTRISKVDGMHFEVNTNARNIKRVADAIRNGSITGTTKPVASKPIKKPAPVKAYPFGKLNIIGHHTTGSLRAWQMLLSAVGYDDKNLTRNFQDWMIDLGYLVNDKRNRDGVMGYYLILAMQKFLKKKGLYNRALDGKRGSWMIKAERAYLNQQAKFLRDGE